MAAPRADVGKLYYAAVFRNDPKPVLELVGQRDLTSFSYFTRANVSEFITFFSKTVVERAQSGKRTVVEEQGNVIYSLARPDGLTGIVITDKKYPALTAHQLVSEVLEEFSKIYPKTQWSTTSTPLALPAMEAKFVKYKNPDGVQGIARIQRELDETKTVLHKTIENVLERGEKLDTLVAKSDNLSYASRSFYTQAKKQNSCCTIM